VALKTVDAANADTRFLFRRRRDLFFERLMPADFAAQLPSKTSPVKPFCKQA
jgi:hypothetical protein